MAPQIKSSAPLPVKSFDVPKLRQESDLSPFSSSSWSDSSSQFEEASATMFEMSPISPRPSSDMRTLSNDDQPRSAIDTGEDSCITKVHLFLRCIRCATSISIYGTPGNTNRHSKYFNIWRRCGLAMTLCRMCLGHDPDVCFSTLPTKDPISQAFNLLGPSRAYFGDSQACSTLSSIAGHSIQVLEAGNQALFVPINYVGLQLGMQSEIREVRLQSVLMTSDILQAELLPYLEGGFL